MYNLVWEFDLWNAVILINILIYLFFFYIIIITFASNRSEVLVPELYDSTCRIVIAGYIVYSVRKVVYCKWKTKARNWWKLYSVNKLELSYVVYAWSYVIYQFISRSGRLCCTWDVSTKDGVGSKPHSVINHTSCLPYHKNGKNPFHSSFTFCSFWNARIKKIW